MRINNSLQVYKMTTMQPINKAIKPMQPQPTTYTENIRYNEVGALVIDKTYTTLINLLG